MWFLVGITILLTGASMANITDENAYYLAETNVERSMDDVIEKSRYEGSELGTSVATRRNDDERRQPDSNEPSNDTGNRKSDKKRSIVKMNVHDRSPTQLQAPTSLSTLRFWPHRQDELVSIDQRRNPMIQERRNPLFSPWGGKRDMQRYRTIAKTRRPVRVPFNSWGGKRNSGSIQSAINDLKRDKFFNWGGKKAPPFNSWGGKRDSGIDFRLVPLNQHQLHRTDPRQREQLNIGENRNDLNSDPAESFSEKMISNETWKKRGSLKPLTSGEMTTLGSATLNSFPRIPFEPWGGKKRGELRFHDSPSTAGLSVTLRKIGRLVPWTA